MTDPQPFSRIAIVGVGLLGASLGLALKRSKNPPQKILGIGRPNSPSLETARSRGAVDEISTDISAAAAADLVILATPILQFPDAMKTLRASLKGGSIITDVGSTKTQVMNWATEIFANSQIAFVGSHPMAGSEKRGPDSARHDLFENGLCLLCDSGDSLATKRVENLWKSVGMRTHQLSPHEHDHWVGMVSHLPHAVAFAVMNAAGKHPEMLAAAAGGFMDTTRIAASDVHMWTDIFLTNRHAVLTSLDEFTQQLSSLRAAIETGNESAIREALTHAKQLRDDLAAKRKGGTPS